MNEIERPDSVPGSKNRQRRAKTPKKITPEYLNNVALHYLDRFAASSKGLRDVLMRRVYRSSQYHQTDETEAVLWIDDIIKRFERSGLLDDQAFAVSRARSLHHQGQSARMVRMKLVQKGIDEAEIDAAISELHDDHQEPEFEAALTFARKRRLGPFRTTNKGPQNRDKDLAALARAGFSYDMALSIIDAESIDDLEDRHRDGQISLRR